MMHFVLEQHVFEWLFEQNSEQSPHCLLKNAALDRCIAVRVKQQMLIA